jgi:hypothetical protein
MRGHTQETALFFKRLQPLFYFPNEINNVFSVWICCVKCLILFYTLPKKGNQICHTTFFFSCFLLFDKFDNGFYEIFSAKKTQHQI